MPVKVKITGTDEAIAEAKRLEQAARDLSPTDDDVAATVVRQNAALNFDPDHPNSVLEVDAGSGEIGSTASSYGKLLDVDTGELAEIFDEHLTRAIDG